eukprot:CFRG1164T1
MGDARYNIHNQLEHLQSRYVGTGHSDTSKFEWLCNQHRDTYASCIGHPNLTQYIAIAENEPLAVVKFRLMKKMFSPCGLPEARDED